MLSIGACLMAEVYKGRQQANAFTCTALIENTLCLKIINSNNKLSAHQRPEDHRFHKILPDYSKFDISFTIPYTSKFSDSELSQLYQSAILTICPCTHYSWLCNRFCVDSSHFAALMLQDSRPKIEE